MFIAMSKKAAYVIAALLTASQEHAANNFVVGPKCTR